MKIIFLDIDGPMKSVRAYFDERLKNNMDGGFDPLNVAIINRLCHLTGAVIVFNTSWNAFQGFKGLIDIAKSEGLKAKITDTTMFPTNCKDRLTAIEYWLLSNKDMTHWVCFDDVKLDHENCIHVDPEIGISPDNYRQASKLLGNEDKFIVLI
jgi:hypothetical protein